MRKRIVLIVCAVVGMMALTYIGLYNSGYIGITDDKINQEQMKTVSWDAHDYLVLGSGSDDSALYVGVMFMKDYSDAKYFIYVNRSGLPFGWCFLQSGDLTELDGLREFDCGKYGKAYAALNAGCEIQRIEFEDGGNPAVIENTNHPIVEQTQSKYRVHFYDKNGDPIEPCVMKVVG